MREAAKIPASRALGLDQDPAQQFAGGRPRNRLGDPDLAETLVRGDPLRDVVQKLPGRRLAPQGHVRDGHLTGYAGVEEVQARAGEWVIDAHLPSPGTPTQPVAAGYMANAYVRMRHPDYDVLRDLLDDVGRTVRVHVE